MSMGALLKRHRIDRGLTLEAVALEAGTDPGNLSRIERDTQQPSAALLQKLARTLGITASALYTELESEGGLREGVAHYDRAMQQFQRKYHELTPANRKLVLEFMKMLGRLQKKD
ncbi:MAG TPA: helix-turn-helix transcriptional regulator [Moraxellaceae bacterium]